MLAARECIFGTHLLVTLVCFTHAHTHIPMLHTWGTCKVISLPVAGENACQKGVDCRLHSHTHTNSYICVWTHFNITTFTANNGTNIANWKILQQTNLSFTVFRDEVNQVSQYVHRMTDYMNMSAATTQTYIHKAYICILALVSKLNFWQIDTTLQSAP